jgi:hypothetical protein
MDISHYSSLMALFATRIGLAYLVGNATTNRAGNWRNLPLRAIAVQLSAITGDAAHTHAHLVKRWTSSFRLIS